MLLRELIGGDPPHACKLILIDDPTGFGHRVTDGGLVLEHVLTQAAEFERVVAVKIAEGFVETERSLTRSPCTAANIGCAPKLGSTWTPKWWCHRGRRATMTLSRRSRWTENDVGPWAHGRTSGGDCLPRLSMWHGCSGAAIGRLLARKRRDPDSQVSPSGPAKGVLCFC